MTEPTAPAPDPFEDRVRRTLAARADDMAPGDSADALPAFGPGHRAARRGRRPVLAAAAVVVVAAATAGLAVVASGGGRDTDRTAAVGQPPPGEADLAAVTTSRALVEALADERGLAAATLLGVEEAVALPLTTAQARSETDAAAASFEAFVATSPDGAAHQSGLDGLGSLAALRRDIDADTGPRDVANNGTAQAVFDRYTAIVGALLDAQHAYAGAIDDPLVRTGVLAHAQGSHLRDKTSQLVRALLIDALAPGSDALTDLVRVRTEVQASLDALLTETTGTRYEEAAMGLVGEVEGSGLLGAADSAMEGNVDLPFILNAERMLEDGGWPAYLDAVEATLAAQG